MNLRGRGKRDEEGEAGEPAVPAPRRPRGATTLLLVAAAVLGLGGGTAYGYHVQADRHPKPLPPLAQPGLSYPKKTLPADAKGSRPPLEENQDHQLVYRGGLDRLVVPLPKGWRQQEDGERTYGAEFGRMGDFAQYELDRGGLAYWVQSDLGSGFSRISGDNWEGPGELSGYVELLEYAPGSNAEARTRAISAARGIETDRSLLNLKTRSGAPGVKVYFWKEAGTDGHGPEWTGRVIGSRGSVAIDMTFWDVKPIDEKFVLGMAKKQWGRL
ncbi:hypothetical protein [Streptomyces sp. NPDC047046]|uniref:hypothetical protein n=1 Tax=Streptomyces sp. NPDC047046 TaxID=3155378 RepID=UPI00340DAEF4